MFRFAIRDMLWLTVVVGLTLVWRVENQARQRSLDVLNRNQAIADQASLAGRWQILETVINGTAQNFRGTQAVEMGFYNGYWMEWGPDGKSGLAGGFMIVRPGEINIDTTGVPGFTAPTKWRYKLERGELWMVRSQKPADRPRDFDALNDPSLTRHRLRKVELRLKPPAVEPPEELQRD